MMVLFIVAYSNGMSIQQWISEIWGSHSAAAAEDSSIVGGE